MYIPLTLVPGKIMEKIIAGVIEKNRKIMQSSVTANMGSQGESPVL